MVSDIYASIEYLSWYSSDASAHDDTQNISDIQLDIYYCSRRH